MHETSLLSQSMGPANLKATEMYFMDGAYLLMSTLHHFDLEMSASYQNCCVGVVVKYVGLFVYLYRLSLSIFNF